MVFRHAVLSGLVLAGLLAGADAAQARPQPAARAARVSPTEAWVSMVVTRITRAGERGAAAEPGGTVTIRIRIGADGAVEGAAVEEGSGSDALDTRVLKAVSDASPFTPPPETLLTLEGFTELSFPLTLGPPGPH